LHYLWLLLLLMQTIGIDIFVIFFKLLSFKKELFEIDIYLKKSRQEDAIDFLEKVNIPINKVKRYYELNTNTIVQKSYTTVLIEEIVSSGLVFLLKGLEYDFKLSFPIPKYIPILYLGYNFVAIVTVDDKCKLFFVHQDETAKTTIEKTVFINRFHLLCFPLKREIKLK
jgi:hypothetical protein